MAIYLIFNYYGILVHESSSLYASESRIFENIQSVLSKNKNTIEISKAVYIKGILSERIKNNLHDQSYVLYFLKRGDIKTYYEHEKSKVPTNALIIESTDLLK